MITTVVVTKRAGLALTLQSPSHRFTELRPVTGWLTREWVEDVIVLDLETADVTLDAIETLRDSGVPSPIIVVANEKEGWDELIALHSDLFLVSLPVTPASLMVTVDRAARSGRASSLSVTAALNLTETQQDVGESEPERPEPGLQAGPQLVLNPDRGSMLGSPPVVRNREEKVPVQRPQVALAKAHTPSVAPPTRPTEQRAAAATRTSRHGDPVSLARDLSAKVEELTSVPDATEALRARCVSAVGCDASAVLVPDGAVWRVSAGQHLRPLEERLQIDETHWLVSEVVKAGHGLIILNTDIARTRLTGAPLASWPNLLALPVPQVGAVVLLARGVKPFGRGDLAKGQRAIGQDAADLKAALDVRSLSRALARFVDDSA